MTEIRTRTLKFIESMRLAGTPYGQYRYASDITKPTLYSSTYAAMTRHLYRDLESLSATGRTQWIEYLQSHQDDDGLFRDPLIFNEGWYKDDPEWCGRRHLSCHVVIALTCLGAVARKPMRFLDPFLRPGGLVSWLESRDWSKRPDFVGNEVFNVGTLMQYARDFQGNKACAEAMDEMLDWMSDHHVIARTGLWGGLNMDDPREQSRAVMGAYHFWLLYFYDGVPIPHPDRAIDSCLEIQNEAGGFGQGVHNPGNPLNSSACEDIDSIDPLARLMTENAYRREDIRGALKRGLTQVLSNQVADGGFVFMRNCRFSYGHSYLTSAASQGAMFPTWFRTLTLAYLGKALPDSLVGDFDWELCSCPGVQFWGRRVRKKAD
ncbi:MAG: hypothetical protein IT427_14305 [Pirellulales bacterium]|nr:hypothetical protein [Pirellulales bacterium]